MSVSSRRFEILLPLRFNDGQPVPDVVLTQVALELEKQFGSVSSEPGPASGTTTVATPSGSTKTFASSAPSSST